MRYKCLGIADRHKNKVYIDKKTKKIFYKHPDGTAEMVDIDDIHYLGRPREDLKDIDKERYKYCYKKVMDKLLKIYKKSDIQILGELINEKSILEIIIRFKFIGKSNNNQETIYLDRKNNKIYTISKFGRLQEIDINNKILNKNQIKRIKETKEIVSTADIKVALIIIILETLLIIKPSIKEIISDYQYEKYLKNKGTTTTECDYTTDKVIEEVKTVISDNENITDKEKEYLSSYFIEYLEDYAYLLDNETVEDMLKQLYQLDIEYTPYVGESTLGTYCNDKITIYGEEDGNFSYPENLYPSTFFHEEIHSAFDHSKIPVGKGISLLEAYCGAVQLKYTDTTSYTQEQEYLLIISKILSIDEVNYLLANVDLEGLKQSIAEKCNVDITIVESVVKKMDEAYVMYVNDEYKKRQKKYDKLRYDISIELAELYIKSKPNNTTHDIYLDNLLNKDLSETSFLESKTEMVYSYKTDSWYESYIEYNVQEDDKYKSKEEIVSENAKEFIEYIYENLDNDAVANTLELFMILCDEEDLALASKDTFYYILTNNLKKYNLEESIDEFILKYKYVLFDNYKLEEYYINEIFQLLSNKYLNKETLTLYDHANIKRLKEIIPYNTYTYYDKFLSALCINLSEEDSYICIYGNVKWIEKNLNEPYNWDLDDEITIDLILTKSTIKGKTYFILPKYLTKYEKINENLNNYFIEKLEEDLVIDAQKNNIYDTVIKLNITYQRINNIEEQKVLSINSNNY